jgi:hypothetical protein
MKEQMFNEDQLEAMEEEEREARRQSLHTPVETVPVSKQNPSGSGQSDLPGQISGEPCSLADCMWGGN